MKALWLAVLAIALAAPAIADTASDTTAAPTSESPAEPVPAMSESAKSGDAAAKPASATTKAGVAKKTPVKDKAVQAIDAQITAAKVDKKKQGWKTSLPAPKSVTFDPAKTYLAHMKTNKGDITIKFLPAVAPMHVTNFIYLTRLGFYDGLSFHRVITGFMAQGGCPIGNGTGSPGYGFNGEFKSDVKHDKGGLLSMANAGPGTDGSQFFLTFVPTPWLDGKHTIFGEVIEGQDVLKTLEAAGSQSGRTSEPLKMEKVTIEVK
jgi:cyclophilin family peptidyl-prolyl cis-trans isomerase